MAAFLGLFDETLSRTRPISHARSLAFRNDESSSQAAGCNLGSCRHSDGAFASGAGVRESNFSGEDAIYNWS